jgi:hypothetical protein
MQRKKIHFKRTTLKLTSGMKAVKFLIFFFNFLFLVSILFFYFTQFNYFKKIFKIEKIIGIKLIVVGSILNVQFKDYLDFQGNTTIGVSAIFIATFGGIITVIAFFGCNGSIRESRCMMLTVRSQYLFN